MLTILQGDALTRLRELPDESVQCCVTSPPYDNLRTYCGFSWDFEAIAKELYRVMCAGGIVCWNIGDSVVDGSETLTSAKQKIFFREQCDFRVHDTMIYEKSNFGHPERSRYHQLYEYVFILSRGKPRVFNPICDKRNTWAGTGTFGRNSVREKDGSMGIRKRNLITEFGMRGNVWRGPTSGQEGQLCNGSIHPAVMPEWLAHDLVLSWSNVGDTILDPFAGSGTTGMVALELSRKAILIELNPKYCDLIRKRCTVTPGFAFT
jgi:site-specific DNA-methyltransferase (adenine-specific)